MDTLIPVKVYNFRPLSFEPLSVHSHCLIMELKKSKSVCCPSAVCVAIFIEPQAWTSFKFQLLLALGHAPRHFSILGKGTFSNFKINAKNGYKRSLFLMFMNEKYKSWNFTLHVLELTLHNVKYNTLTWKQTEICEMLGDIIKGKVLQNFYICTSLNLIAQLKHIRNPLVIYNNYVLIPMAISWLPMQAL